MGFKNLLLEYYWFTSINIARTGLARIVLANDEQLSPEAGR